MSHGALFPIWTTEMVEENKGVFQKYLQQYLSNYKIQRIVIRWENPEPLVMTPKENDLLGSTLWIIIAWPNSKARNECGKSNSLFLFY